MLHPLSTHQLKILTYLVNVGSIVQIAGYGRAGSLSAARALVRKGLASSALRTGYFSATVSGKNHIKYLVLLTKKGKAI